MKALIFPSAGRCGASTEVEKLSLLVTSHWTPLLKPFDEFDFEFVRSKFFDRFFFVFEELELGLVVLLENVFDLFFDFREIIFGDLEVCKIVVEAVFDGWADGWDGFRVEAEDRLSEDVGRGVPENFFAALVVEV